MTNLPFITSILTGIGSYSSQYIPMAINRKDLLELSIVKRLRRLPISKLTFAFL
jgi:hypothetical protein